MKRHIPNLITLLNLLSGCIAVVLVANNHLVMACLFVFLGIFFDFFDGLVARKLNVQSDLGVQLDSLADMVTSGLVPGLVMYKLILLAEGNSLFESQADWGGNLVWSEINLQPIALLGFIITLASCYRLAKFNIDEDQKFFFKGLPTPANTILVLSFPLILEFQNNDLINNTITNTWFLLGITCLSSYLLIAPVKLFALKFKTWDFNTNSIRYIFIILCVVFLIIMKFAAIPLIILTYIIMSLFSQKTIV